RSATRPMRPGGSPLWRISPVWRGKPQVGDFRRRRPSFSSTIRPGVPSTVSEGTLATEERLTPKCATISSIGRDIENRRDNSGLRSSLLPQTIMGTYEEQLPAPLDGNPHKFF